MQIPFCLGNGLWNYLFHILIVLVEIDQWIDFQVIFILWLRFQLTENEARLDALGIKEQSKANMQATDMKFWTKFWCNRTCNFDFKQFREMLLVSFKLSWKNCTILVQKQPFTSVLWNNCSERFAKFSRKHLT